LASRWGLLSVYPTNELLRDQVSSIRRLAEQEGLTVCVFTPEAESGYSQADVVLIPIDGDLLSAWCKKRRYTTKGRALQELLTRDRSFKIVLTNPDVLFLIFALRYRPEVLAALQQYHVLVVDEFHLYTGVELAHALLMADLGRRLGAFEKLLLLSATPDPDTWQYMERLFQPRRITLADQSGRPVTDKRWRRCASSRCSRAEM
jgi:CRISPR-associated endonuclease/helicase Cas3